MYPPPGPPGQPPAPGPPGPPGPPQPQNTEEMLRMVMALTPDQLAALPPPQRAEIENLRARIAEEARQQQQQQGRF